MLKIKWSDGDGLELDADGRVWSPYWFELEVHQTRDGPVYVFTCEAPSGLPAEALHGAATTLEGAVLDACDGLKGDA